MDTLEEYFPELLWSYQSVVQMLAPGLRVVNDAILKLELFKCRPICSDEWALVTDILPWWFSASFHPHVNLLEIHIILLPLSKLLWCPWLQPRSFFLGSITLGHWTQPVSRTSLGWFSILHFLPLTISTFRAGSSWQAIGISMLSSWPVLDFKIKNEQIL